MRILPVTRTGWTNLAVFALCAAIASAQVVTAGGWWVLRSLGVAGFVVAAVRCTIRAAHAPDRRYKR